MLNVTNSTSPTPAIDIEKCILCQKSKKEYLSQSDNGKAKLLDAARVLPSDERSERILQAAHEKVKYHSVSCYATFIKASKRHINQEASSSSTEDTTSENTRPKRQKTESKSCVVCGQDRIWDNSAQKRIHEVFRVSEAHRAQKLLNAAELNKDEVYTRIVFCYENGIKDIFARDIYYHGNLSKKVFQGL